jgi:hypothetical protein
MSIGGQDRDTGVMRCYEKLEVMIAMIRAIISYERLDITAYRIDRTTQNYLDKG